MSRPVISVENLSKSYQLGVIGTGTFRGDLQRWWARQRGRPDPYRKVGENDHGSRQGEMIWAPMVTIRAWRHGLDCAGRPGLMKLALLHVEHQTNGSTIRRTILPCKFSHLQRFEPRLCNPRP
jgi:lipopolysaccharide transport system ATP-binding protein